MVACIDLAKFSDIVDYDKLMTILGRTIQYGEGVSVAREYPVSGVMNELFRFVIS